MKYGYVYVIEELEEGKSRKKIGFTTRKPLVRLKELQTGNSNPLNLVGYFEGSTQLEQNLHVALKAFRKEGEWFEFDLVTLLEALAYTVGKALEAPPERSESTGVEVGDYQNVRVIKGPLEGLSGYYSNDGDWTSEMGSEYLPNPLGEIACVWVPELDQTCYISYDAMEPDD